MTRVLFAFLTLMLSLQGLPALAQSSYLHFESGPVRPMALSADGSNLFVVNTPDNRLEMFSVSGGTLQHVVGIPVGMEPVAVALRGNEAWVVNHLSDSVSIVDLGSFPIAVKRTLLVGDEPRDIVFAGPSGNRAFITTAHRGQHRTHASIAAVPGAGDPELSTEGVSRADVWVFDATSLGSPLGGTPLEIVELFGDTPRALAVSNDGNTVYAAVFHSGNQTTAVNELIVCDGFAGAGSCSIDGGTSPGGNPGPSTNHQFVNAPEVGLIVQFDPVSGEWRDELDRDWSSVVRFSLPDHDVFAIDATTLNTGSIYDHVGTILFNMAVNPVNGKIYVTNGEAQNLTRFEGDGTFGGSTVQGNLAQYRVTVLSGASTVEPRHLNKHIDYGILPAPVGTAAHSIATPMEMAITSDGAKLYVAAFGSGKVGVYDTADLEDDSFDPTAVSANHIPLSGGGPAGLVLNESAQRLYVYTRFDNSIAIVNTATDTEVGTVPLSNPEPAEVLIGRPMLYDAATTSSNGEASCSSCHIFGDFDSLAWDLGDPDGDITDNVMPATPAGLGSQGGAAPDEFHPMKGPMTTQTLRGMQNGGGMHWRGDRVDGFFGQDVPYLTMGGNDAGDESLNFDNFIVAFPGLVGGATPATDAGLQADMMDFTDFALEIVLPPNPVRNLDNSLTASESSALTFYDTQLSDGVATCEGCHDLVPANGFFGTGGLASFEGETQNVKVPHLRNMYAKVGMFGMPNLSAFLTGDGTDQGDQVRGFGFLHDGTVDTVFRFFRAVVFALPGIGFANDTERRNMEELMFAFDSDLAPIVGQQVTDDGSVSADVTARIALLRARAGAAFTSKLLGGVVTECDLIAKTSTARGALYDPVAGDYVPDRQAEPTLSQANLDAIADVAGQAVTYTCAPPGSGLRMAIDRDLDGALDGDELDAGTNPANAGSITGACNDGIDNDGDGLTDIADTGCTTLFKNIENPQCSDGVDNDGDGAIDLADSKCSGNADDSERLGSSCGLGFEAALLLAAAGRRQSASRTPPIAAVRRVRSAGSIT